MAKKHELSWSGEPAPKRSGGFVDGVGLNQAGKALAVDPEGQVTERKTSARPAGPVLTVDRMDEGPGDGAVRATGRVRLTRT